MEEAESWTSQRLRDSDARDGIIQAATHHFAQSGFRGARLSEIAADASLTKAAIPKHFGTRDDLLPEVHRRAWVSLPAYLDASKDALDRGAFETFRYWLEQSNHLMLDDFEN